MYDVIQKRNYKGNRRKLASYSELKQQKNQENQNFLGRIVSSTFNNLGKVLGAAAIWFGGECVNTTSVVIAKFFGMEENLIALTKEEILEICK